MAVDFDDLLDQRVEVQPLAAGRRFLDATEFEGLDAEFDGAIEGSDELRREFLHGRIVDHGEAVGNELSRGQHVAQVVADLAHRQAQGSQAALLLQEIGKLVLHVGELALGDADLVAARARLNDAAPVFRIGGESQHVHGDAPDRAYEHRVQREKDQAWRR